MKVKELIKKLQEMPDDMIVLILPDEEQVVERIRDVQIPESLGCVCIISGGTINHG